MIRCCSTKAIAEQFDRDAALEELRRYRKDGPLPTTRALIDALAARGIQDGDLLDVGGGAGAIHHALLERGVQRATHVDISTEYIGVARAETDRIGHSSRVTFVPGDFVTVAPQIGAADVVTLDRVICCYPDMDGLLKRSAERARRMLGAVYPRDTWWVHVGVALQNVLKRLSGSDFRAYLHSPAAIEALLLRAGLVRASTQRTWIWEVAIYVRPG